MSTIKEKPTSEIFRPELVRLPPLTWWQNAKRSLLKTIAWLLVRMLMKVTVIGRQYFPTEGPMLMVSNHLGDADGIVGLAVAKVPFDVMAKIELYDIPVFGRILEWYGAIWVHRGRPDRRALRAIFDGLAQDRMVAIAPEGRESLTGGLEEGTDGASYVALKADVPILPVVFTGTENRRVYRNLKRLQRTQVTVKAGPPFRLTKTGDRRTDIRQGTQTIMKTLAWLLPPEYQGVYRNAIKEDHDGTESG
jgi:1-acyl-sn-glycerol-3-phosphate acyltransferase